LGWFVHWLHVHCSAPRRLQAANEYLTCSLQQEALRRSQSIDTLEVLDGLGAMHVTSGIQDSGQGNGFDADECEKGFAERSPPFPHRGVAAPLKRVVVVDQRRSLVLMASWVPAGFGDTLGTPFPTRITV